MAITIEPAGGLGNQLFHWAAGWSLARAKGVRLVADTVHYVCPLARSWELDSFDSGIDATTSSSRREQRLRNRLASLPGATRWFVTDRSSRVSPPASRISSRARLRGYFQNASFFAAYAEDIRERVRTISHPSPWFLETAARLKGMESFIGIHVRRGDYIHLPQHGVLPHSYYKAAVEQLVPDAPPGTPVIVTTDEPNELLWVSGLAPGSRCEILRPPPESRPIESLILLSMARYLVTANSTWSWWAGFVGNAQTVCYPNPWFRDAGLVWPEPPSEQWRPIDSAMS